MIDYSLVVLLILFFVAVPFVTLQFEKYENKMDEQEMQLKMAKRKALEEQIEKDKLTT